MVGQANWQIGRNAGLAAFSVAARKSETEPVIARIDRNIAALFRCHLNQYQRAIGYRNWFSLGQLNLLNPGLPGDHRSDPDLPGPNTLNVLGATAVFQELERGNADIIDLRRLAKSGATDAVAVGAESNTAREGERGKRDEGKLFHAPPTHDAMNGSSLPR